MCFLCWEDKFCSPQKGSHRKETTRIQPGELMNLLGLFNGDGWRFTCRSRNDSKADKSLRDHPSPGLGWWRCKQGFPHDFTGQWGLLGIQNGLSFMATWLVWVFSAGFTAFINWEGLCASGQVQRLMLLSYLLHELFISWILNLLHSTKLQRKLLEDSFSSCPVTSQTQLTHWHQVVLLGFRSYIPWHRDINTFPIICFQDVWKHTKV